MMTNSASEVAANRSVAPLRLLMVCSQAPYPPNHGGAVDMWRRIEAFYDAGVELDLLCWTSESLSIAQQEAFAARFGVVNALVIGRTLHYRLPRVLQLYRYPLAIALRSLSRSASRDLVYRIGLRKPDAVWLDGIGGGRIAERIADSLNVPLIMRSHNIEHRYWARQARLATSVPDSVRHMLRAAHLKRFESHILRRSDRYYDISLDDLNYWRSEGLNHGAWLPPLAAKWLAESPTATRSTATHDLVFLGNLRMPNNVAGLQWFAAEVLPRVIPHLPGLSVLIAGSDPSEAIVKLCNATAGVSLLANPAHAHDVLQAGKVLVNPVLDGSGVAIKSIDMLFVDRVRISTLQGVHGLPAMARDCFFVAETAEEFAGAIILALKQDLVPPGDVLQAREAFDPKSIGRVVSDIQTLAKGAMQPKDLIPNALPRGQ